MWKQLGRMRTYSERKIKKITELENNAIPLNFFFFLMEVRGVRLDSIILPLNCLGSLALYGSKLHVLNY